ncbi:peptidase S41 [Elizabethkingia argentiflava]|uniref:Peptidase S41 n=1 Tax=Elizabethkingia argenteiflava TaxID=2681556 RepID=A0A845Q0H7_9FLAO|nr:S41 family peptidase [Elizabethkingia argenteiflava]NAW52138.1 peptidase S41 [Elizabethkingia argenteiflava]
MTKINFNKKIIFGLGLFFILGSFSSSCVSDEDVTITQPELYSDDDVKSYADLFKIFWTAMDQRYNYFYEQKRKDGMNWNDIYSKYYPKFQALKSFQRGDNFTDKEISEDSKKAIQYFTEIIDPIIDRHFSVDILLNGSKTTYIKKNFRGGMSEKPHNIYRFDKKYAYMKDRLQTTAKLQVPELLLAGNLKSNPDIYYFSFSEYVLSKYFQIKLADKYLSPDPGNIYLLTEAEIEKNPRLNAIKDINFRNKVKSFTLNIWRKWNSLAKAEEVKRFNEQVDIFNNTEEVTDQLLYTAEEALKKYYSMPLYDQKFNYQPVYNSESRDYIQWFMHRMDEYVKFAYEKINFGRAVFEVNEKGPFYKNFLNPLHQGKIKKLILDLRGNGGGNVMDARFFVDRLITKSAVWGYQRTKQGNGRFNYTPWIPMHTKTHKFGLPSNIPIVVLTDKGSFSMAEITTLMLKSQGSQVISMGDYSGGATAGLGSSDLFNGGLTSKVTSYLDFYMPMMATKDVSGKVVEGIGVKPNVYIGPPSDAEVEQMKASPKTFVDKVMLKAIEHLSSK